MKRRIILAVIAIPMLIFIALYLGVIIAVIIGLLIPCVHFILKLRKKDLPSPARPQFIDLQEAIDSYGNPDDIILVNPVHGSQADGVILNYDEKELMIVCGFPVLKKDIVDVTFNNAAIAYFECDYQIVFTLATESDPYIFVHVGNDASFAKDVLEQIKHHLNIP